MTQFKNPRLTSGLSLERGHLGPRTLRVQRKFERRIGLSPLPEDLAEQSLAFAQAHLSAQSRTGRFAEPQPVEETAPAIDRLAAFLGRPVPPQR
jgi:hypothetical protein